MTLLKRTQNNLKDFVYGKRVSRRFVRQYLRQFEIDNRRYRRNPHEPSELDPNKYGYLCVDCKAVIQNKELIYETGMVARCPFCFTEYIDPLYMEKAEINKSKLKRRLK